MKPIAIWQTDIGVLFFQSEIDVVILAFAPYTESSCLNAREDDSHELAERCRV